MELFTIFLVAGIVILAILLGVFNVNNPLYDTNNGGGGSGSSQVSTTNFTVIEGFVGRVNKEVWRVQNFGEFDTSYLSNQTIYQVNGKELVNGSRIEIQVKTVDQAIHDVKDHSGYAERRLAKNGHADLTKYQIVVYDNRAVWNGPVHYENKRFKVAKIANKFADYWLIMDKGGEQPDPMTKLKNPLGLLEQLR